MPATARLFERPAGWAEELNQPLAQAHFRLKAELMKQYAKETFIGLSHHESEEPYLYANSFYIRKVFGPLRVGNVVLTVGGYRMGNFDPVAGYVEFGGAAGEDHQTPILKYRIFGRTIDAFTIGG